MKNVLDRLQKVLEVNDDRDKIVDDTLVENGEPNADPGVDKSNVGAGLTFPDSTAGVRATLAMVAVILQELRCKFSKYQV